MHDYQITALELGSVLGFPADIAFDGALYPGEFLYSTFMMVLLRGEGKNILVDSGFDPSDPEKASFFSDSFVSNPHGPGEVLAEVGLTPEDIDAVILTHAHWDHAGALDCFPRAKVYLQRRELEEWRGVVESPSRRFLADGILDPRDLQRLEALREAGRLELLDGDVDDLFPGIHIRVSTMSHSFALQMVLAETGGGIYVLASDAFFRLENLVGTPEDPRFFPMKKFAVGSVVNTLDTYEKILSWANGQVDHIISAHDGTAHERFPSRVSKLGLHIIEVYPGGKGNE